MMLNKNTGFTLVELMIAAAALGGLAIVGMNLTKQMTKSTVKMKYDSETTFITNEIIQILSNPDKCIATFKNKSAISSTVSNINGKFFISSDNANAPAGGYGNGNISIESYQVTGTAPETDNSARLSINYITKEILKSGNKKPAIVDLYVTVTPGTNLITSCRSVSSGSLDIWSRGVDTDIYYSPGNVGIGTPSPAVALHVVNDLQQQVIRADGSHTDNTAIWINNSSASGRAYALASTGSANINGSGKFLIADGTAGGAVRLGIDSTGSVGIGTANPAFKLDVAGSINSSSAITASSFQYTSDKNLKEEVKNIVNGDSILMKLRAVKFRWKKDKTTDYGFIAQEVKAVVPEITSIDANKIMHVDYAKIIPFLVDTVQKQQKEIDELKKKIK